MSKSHEPKTTEEARRAIRLFCDKCDLIRGYSLWAFSEFSIKGRFSPDEPDTPISYTGPSSEQIDAVLLHVRFFLNRNEGSHIGYIPACLSILSVNQEDRELISVILEQKNQWSRAPSGFDGIDNSKLFSILIYGSRIHANESDFVDDYAEFMRFEMFKEMELFHLASAVGCFMSFMFSICEVLKKYRD